MVEYNIYCDESCHLPHDNSDLMVIGGISCPKDKTDYINKAIREIKRCIQICRDKMDKSI